MPIDRLNLINQLNSDTIIMILQREEEIRQAYRDYIDGKFA